MSPRREGRGVGEGVYAEPRVVTSLEECHFYHAMEIPGYGLVEGPCDHRRGVDAYLGHVDLRGKRVLEIGTASGFFCFEMERRGAEVVGYDLSDRHSWDSVPYAKYDHDRFTEERRAHLRRINNAWWLAHAAFQSRARVVYGTVYEIPAEIGPFNVATFGNVLRHIRDPFLALQQALRLTTETAIVTEDLSLLFSIPQMMMDPLKPAMVFLPNARKLRPLESWWLFTPGLIRRMLGVLGFEDTKVNYHFQRIEGRRKLHFTVVGRRTQAL